MDTLPSSQIVQVKGFCPVCVLICSWTLPIWLPWWLLWIPAVAIDNYCCYCGFYGYLTFITDSARERFLSSMRPNVFLDIANLVAMVVAMDTLPLSQIVQGKGFSPVCVLMCSLTLPIWLLWWLLWIPYLCHR